MKEPKNLTRDSLIRLVTQIRDAAYMSSAGDLDYFDGDKEIDGADFVQTVLEWLAEYDLCPDEAANTTKKPQACSSCYRICPETEVLPFPDKMRFGEYRKLAINNGTLLPKGVCPRCGGKVYPLPEC